MTNTQAQQFVDNSQAYNGDYLVTLVGDTMVMVELDALVLDLEGV